MQIPEMLNLWSSGTRQLRPGNEHEIVFSSIWRSDLVCSSSI